MNEERAMALMDRMAGDAELRVRFAQDPVGVFEASGVELTEEDRRMLLSVKGLESDQLAARISKSLW